MTLTLAAVYAPVAFSPPAARGGSSSNFALTLAGAVIISGFVALTLTPMMCSRLLKHEEKPGRVSAFIEGRLRAMEKRLSPAAGFDLEAPPADPASRARRGGRQCLLPDRAALGTLTGRGSRRRSRHRQRAGGLHPRLYLALHQPDRHHRLQRAEVDSVLIINGFPEVHRFLVIGRLKDWGERDVRQQELVAKLTPELRRIARHQCLCQQPALARRLQQFTADRVRAADLRHL